jgi:hypothetical protein
MSRASFPVVVLALAVVLGLVHAHGHGHSHNHRKLMTNPVARPGVLKGFQLKPTSGSSGDAVVAQQVDTQVAEQLQRSIKNSGFKGTQSQLIARLQSDDDLVSAVPLTACSACLLVRVKRPQLAAASGCYCMPIPIRLLVLQLHAAGVPPWCMSGHIS